MSYQINSSKLFLTYPKCDVPKTEALEALISKFDVKHYVIAEELHKNGDKHLHAYLELNSAFRTRDCHFADLGLHHGSYEGCRSSKNVIKYCTKEDNYISDLDINEIINSRQSHRKLIGKELISGKPLHTLVDENPSLIFGYKKLKEDVNEYFKDKHVEERDDLPSTLPNSWNLLLPVDLDIKQCHYWIWSSIPNKGKTTFGNDLVSKYKGIIKSTDFSYWNIGKDTELIILDEFRRGSLKAQQLNSICDGTFEYRVFMQGLVKLYIGKPLVIVLSNFPIKEVYPFMNELIYARFNEIELSP